MSMPYLAVWYLIMMTFPILSTGALRTWSPGQALSLNTGGNKTEYAYTYPRRLGRAFTMEFWGNAAGSMKPDYCFWISVAHPKEDNLVQLADWVYVLGVPIFETKGAMPFSWTHYAVAVDTRNYPTVHVALYTNGSLWKSVSTELSMGSPPESLEQDALSIVFGGDQDAILGGWDYSQIMSGHIDEFRVWSRVRTATEIRENYRFAVPPDSPGLLMYYSFDDLLNATCIWDRVNASAEWCMQVADSHNPATIPTVTPDYSPAASPLARLTVSTAPVCSTSGSGQLYINAAANAELEIPVETLYCGEVFPTVVVTGVVGGTLMQNGVEAVGLPLDGNSIVLYRAASGPLPMDAGFTFRVQNGQEIATGMLSILKNQPPVLPAEFIVTGSEDKVCVLWLRRVLCRN